MRSFVVALSLTLTVFATSGCSDDDTNSPDVDTSSDDAQAYLAELEAAGLDDLFEDDEQAVAYVATACADAATLGQTPEQVIESGAANEQAVIALGYCETELAG